ncbi:DNA pilot protein [Blackfly microvirus SF02]|uniref:DNA pilot protein n=1 Tax=Blackfly microvirus SF02 TaxID=2576452 RepID=A0A4P8PUB2_9VIRU|nr:DNA pilot protein [Blackfly microvirus SF02]
MKINFKPILLYDLLPAISAGSGLIGGIIDAVTANSRAKDAQGFADAQANKQRAWAVEDRDWQANYNSPVNIMARYKQAGLNPNLIYGNNGFQAPATRSTPAASPYIAQPGIGKAVGESIQTYQDASLKQAQTENAQQMLQNLQQDNLNKQADLVRKNIENVILATDPRSNIREQEDFRDIERANIQNRADITAQQDLSAMYNQQHGEQMVISDRRNNAIGAALQESNISIGLQKAIQSLQGTEKNSKNLQILDILKQKMLNDVDLQRLDIDMQNGGINAKSPFYQKILSGLLDGVMMYLGGKMNPGGFSSPNTQRPSFNPGVPQPGGNYRPPNSGFKSSALYNRNDLYNR